MDVWTDEKIGLLCHWLHFIHDHGSLGEPHMYTMSLFISFELKKEYIIHVQDKREIWSDKTNVIDNYRMIKEKIYSLF